MRLTTFTDYSLRVLIYLGAHRGERATIAEIAAAFGVSENHLTKVVHVLGREGFLSNTRGRGGGLELARATRDINVGAVVRSTEGGAVPAECFEPGNEDCLIVRACRLRGVLKQAVDAFYAVLDQYTLEDLVTERSGVARLLRFDRPPPKAGRAG
jgi:Rrf2 family nitric oxide-sensitive transcriptional repressor